MATNSRPLVPATLLTGFLGAGKTTLLKRLLSHPNDEKILIVENEFGPVNIDSQLLPQKTDIDVVQMTSGCICCSVQGEWIAALHKLNQQRQMGTLKFDRLIIETTGLADPAPLLQTFFIDEQFRETFQLDGVVTLIDAVHIIRQLEEHGVVRSQIGFADRLIITKSDLVSKESLQHLITHLTAMNQKAQITLAYQGQLTKTDWLDIRAFDLTDELKINTACILNDDKNHVVLSPSRITPMKTDKIDNDIRSYLFEGAQLDIKKIGQFVEYLIAEHGNDMLRYKGIFAIEGNPARLIVQGVHKVVGFDYGSPWQANERRKSQFVVISRPLPFQSLSAQFMKTQTA